MDNGGTASACGKIILSGEYAVLFGHRGIAMPSKERLTALWIPSGSTSTVQWTGASKEWISYAQKILIMSGAIGGILDIQTDIPIGKGMGSSTALVIAVCRAVLGSDCRAKALQIENELSPGNSGLDFAVIWEEKPIVYRKNERPEIIDIAADFELIDTGAPGETTPELVTWVREKYDEIPKTKTQNPSGNTPSWNLEFGIWNFREAIDVIGECTERILKGEPLKTVMHDHHKAQVALGVVPNAVQEIIADIEAKGGAAKVIGAGGKTGGGGMVLVIR